MIAEVIIFLVLLYLLGFYFKTKDKLPPGPWRIPFIGTLPVANVQQCVEMKEKYGNLFMIKCGAYNLLYILDYKLSKEAFSKTEFANRPAFTMFQFFRAERQLEKSTGILFSNDDLWHHNRRFLLRHLRDLGMGKSRMEGVIMTEVEDLIEDFKLLTDKPTTLPLSINISVLNIVWQLIASHRYKFTDRKVREFMNEVEEIEKYFMIMGIPDFFPILNYIMPSFVLNYLTGRASILKASQRFTDIIQPFIDDHLDKLDSDNPIDLIDDYLVEMKKKSEEFSHFHLTDLTKITFDLFTAGSDTTSNMIRWVLLYMAKFPLIQEKVQEEIDKVVGRETFPGLEHRDNLSYLDATINEVQRHCSMVSFGLPRGLVSATTLNGYHIPKNTAVYSITAWSHHDPTYWKNPDTFDPSRFLDTNGKFIPTCEGFHPFGIGKRQCIGEQFARMELYLMIGALLQTFTFSGPDDQEIDISPADFPTFQFPRKDKKYRIKLRK